MSTATVSLLKAPAPERIVPDVDPALGDTLGDEILIGLVRSTKVQRVKSGGARMVGSALRSHQARAWSAGGNVD